MSILNEPEQAYAPHYWREACEELMHKDVVLKKIILKYNSDFLVTRKDPFNTLVRSIVGQQISVAAAQSIWNKVEEICRVGVNPGSVLSLSFEDLRGAGLSGRKVEYIKDLAKDFHTSRINSDHWYDMDDESVIKELCSIRGIGRWTAEMYLIFNLLRPNILPLDDIGLINAISGNYFDGEAVSRKKANELGDKWAPWRTVATWYLWRSIDPIPVAY